MNDFFIKILHRKLYVSVLWILLNRLAVKASILTTVWIKLTRLNKQMKIGEYITTTGMIITF
jgi:hypothetical protein